MSAPTGPARTPLRGPGTGIEIQERHAWSINEWFGVLGARS